MNGRLISILVGMVGQTGSLTDAQWRIRWEWNWPAWATVLAAAIVAAWVFAIYAREVSPSGKRVRMALGLLRIAALLIVVLMLAQPTMEWFRLVRPRLVVLIDRSESMGTHDVLLPDPSEGAEELARLDAVKRLLVEGEEPLLERLGKKYQIEVVAFDKASLLMDSSSGALAENLLLLNTTGDTSDGTSLGGAILDVLRDLPGQAPAAVLVFTDGVTTQGPTLDEASRGARGLRVPVFSVAVGSERRRLDVAIENIVVEELVFPGDRLQVEAIVRTTGLAGRMATVKLFGGEAPEVLAQTDIELPADGEEALVRLALRPAEPGELALALVVESFEEEENVENNTARGVVEVSEKKVQTLLIQASPSYEYRALKSLLERDPAIDLHVVLQEADARFSEVDEAALAAFPSSEQELSKYDVLIVGDVDPVLLPSRVWPMVEKFVVEQGGGMICIAGPRFMPGAYRDVSALQVLLPIEPDATWATSADSNSSQTYSIEPTALGRWISSLLLGETASDSEAVWRGLPPVAWLLEGVRPKLGAQVLAASRSSEGELRPVILRQYVGAGEVLFHGTDETWRWRWRTDDRYFARYWGQAVRQLGRGRLGANRKGVQFSVDRSQYEPGEQVRLQLRFQNSSQMPSDGEEMVVELRGTSGTRREVVLRRGGAHRGIFEAVVENLLPDKYEARIFLSTSEVESGVVRFEVKQPQREWARVAVDLLALQSVADASGGRVVKIGAVTELLDHLPVPQPTLLDAAPGRKLWNNHMMVGLFVLCLSVEWLLRRRYGML